MRQKKTLLALGVFLIVSFFLLVLFGYWFRRDYIENKPTPEKKVENEQKRVLPHDNSMIRVVITQSGNYYYKSPQFLLKGNYKLVNRNLEEKQKKKEDVIKFKRKQDISENKNDCVKIIPQQEDARLILINDHGESSHQFRGNIYIYYREKGFFIVNELTVREYLYGVVPSEMPSNYEMEALKAQAVCARSYAYKQLMKHSLNEFYADVDDTTSFQVYHVSKEKKSTCRAVDETENVVVKYKNEIATTYYYSTSCGMTQSYQHWNLKKERFSYLQSRRVSRDERNFDGSVKEYLQKKYKHDLEAGYRYYRWEAFFSLKGNKECLNAMLNKRKRADNDSVSFYFKDNTVCLDVKKLGEPVKINVVERNSGYGINKMEILYKEGKAILSSEYTIRAAIAACKVKVKLADKSIIYPELLPSACFYVESIEKGKIKLCGGGFGHGIGMSQNAANEMAKQGDDYETILQFFYKDVVIEKIIL